MKKNVKKYDKMGKKTVRLFAMAALATVVLAIGSCSHEKNVLQDPRVILEYNLDRTDSTLVAVETRYSEVINATEFNKKQVKPGVYADYAVTLALDRKFHEADSFFALEVQNYPESEKYVGFLKSNMTSEAGQLRVCKERIDDSIAREEALKKQLGDDFDFGKVTYPKGSKEYKQQQKEKKLAKKAKEKEKKKAKKEREKAKKAAKKEREMEKQQLKDERERQKKEVKKAREQQKKEQAKAREREKRLRSQQRAGRNSGDTLNYNGKSVLETILSNDSLKSDLPTDTINK